MKKFKKGQIWVDRMPLSGHWKVDREEYFVIKDVKKEQVFIRQIYLYEEGHSHEGWVSKEFFRDGYKWVMD